MGGLLRFTLDLFEGLGSEFAPRAPAPKPPRRLRSWRRATWCLRPRPCHWPTP